MSDTLTLRGAAGRVRVVRDAHGLPHVTAASLPDAMLGLGYCHARDRGMQILLVRTLARGRACEQLRDADDLFALDTFFRRLNFTAGIAAETAALAPDARAFAAAYCHGVNAYFASHAIPWELRAMGYSVDRDPWTIADVFLTAKIVGYVGLAQSQADVERFLVQCVQGGVARDKLEALFPGQLGGLDESLLRQVTIGARIVPAALDWLSPLPRATASNNWAIAGSKTASGMPLLANDPHLDVDRLPGVWYEAVLQWPSAQTGRPRYAIGSTMPGCPGLVTGRTPELAWGVTYAYMDCVDSWVEHCRAGQYRAGADEWRSFTLRRETIARNRGAAVELTFHENPHGTLDGDAQVEGYHLATRWACGEGTGAPAIGAIPHLLEATSVPAALPLLGQIGNSAWSWVAADREGNIGFQMSGRAPLRRPGVTGLVPLPGWDPANDWQGFAPLADLPRALNPPEGFIATANEMLNHLGRAHPQNATMAPYRGQRIAEVLAAGTRLTVEDMKRLHFDVRSKQAEAFMAVARPLLPEFSTGASAANARLLAGWDHCYDNASSAPTVFEAFYRALIEETFTPTFGPTVLAHLLDRTGIFTNFFGNFDRIMLAETSPWFGDRPRASIYRSALERALPQPAHPFGRDRTFTLKHLLLGDKLPRWLGLDRGPIELLGNRATVHQGQIRATANGRKAVGPSLRFITDLATDEAHTCAPGGPSDRRFSPWYNNETSAWAKGHYKLTRPDP